MIIVKNEYIASLLVDRPDVTLAHAENTKTHDITRKDVVNYVPISELKHGKFRRLFNRHHRAFL